MISGRSFPPHKSKNFAISLSIFQKKYGVACPEWVNPMSLESDCGEEFQDMVLPVHHAYMHKQRNRHNQSRANFPSSGIMIPYVLN